MITTAWEWDWDEGDDVMFGLVTIALSIVMELLNKLIHLICWEVVWVQSEVFVLKERESTAVCVCEDVRV